MNEQRIREIANQASAYAEVAVDFYRGIGDDGLTWEAKILKTRDLKFAELIVKECIERIKRVGILEDIENETDMVVDAVKEHFGVEE